MAATDGPRFPPADLARAAHGDTLARLDAACAPLDLAPEPGWRKITITRAQQAQMLEDLAASPRLRSDPRHLLDAAADLRRGGPGIVRHMVFAAWR